MHRFYFKLTAQGGAGTAAALFSAPGIVPKGTVLGQPRWASLSSTRGLSCLDYQVTKVLFPGYEDSSDCSAVLGSTATVLSRVHESWAHEGTGDQHSLFITVGETTTKISVTQTLSCTVQNAT